MLVDNGSGVIAAQQFRFDQTRDIYAGLLGRWRQAGNRFAILGKAARSVSDGVNMAQRFSINADHPRAVIHFNPA